MAKTLKKRIQALEEKALPQQSFARFDPLGLGVEDVSDAKALTDMQKESIVRERVKAFVKRNWSRMDPDIRKSYMKEFSGLGLRLNGEVIEEAPST